MAANPKPRKQPTPLPSSPPTSGPASRTEGAGGAFGGRFRDGVGSARFDVSTLPRTFGDIGPVLVHDFKGPLSAIALNLDFVMEQLPAEATFDAVRAALGECRQAEERIFRVIANLLDVARCEEGRLSLRIQPVILLEVLTTVLAEHHDEVTARGIDLRVEVASDLPEVDTDVDLLSRVLHNLIDNALRSTKNEGTLIVSATADNGELDLRVANDGPPIAPAVRSRIFQRYLGSEYNGAGANRGIGLYFCRLALAELGATISLVDNGPFPVCFQIRHPFQSVALELASYSSYVG
jgi:two-component system sensor histidine kinase/response regulator